MKAINIIMNEKELKAFIREGKNTVSAIESEVDYSHSYVSRKLKELKDEDVLVREREGRTWVYHIKEQYERDNQEDWGGNSSESPNQAAGEVASKNQQVGNTGSPTPNPSPGMDGQMNMPVNRDYDFSDEIPEDVPPYIPSGDELAQLLGSIKTRHESGKLPRFLIGGPTGCGKTHLAKFIAQHLEIPMFTVQGKWALNESDLLGGPVMVGDTSWWVDGELTKAILASKDQPVLLLVDEVNRARSDSKGVLYPALDDRCEVRLDMRGGEKITGDPSNLIVIGTVNEGRGYHNEEMDLAEVRRLSTKHNVDYLGKEHPDREASLVANRTPASENIARILVETANIIRVMAEKRNNINIGIPTANIISWAQEAYAYDEQDMPNPLYSAAKATVLRPYYDSTPDAKSKVQGIIQDKFDGAPFTEDEFEQWKGKDIHKHIEEVKEERKQEEQN